jgi:hypothetical protein
MEYKNIYILNGRERIGPKHVLCLHRIRKQNNCAVHTILYNVHHEEGYSLYHANVQYVYIHLPSISKTEVVNHDLLLFLAFLCALMATHLKFSSRVDIKYLEFPIVCPKIRIQTCISATKQHKLFNF